jgi:hypothetical protein
MALGALLGPGIVRILVIDNKLLLQIILHQLQHLSHVVFLKDQFLVHYYFSFL